MSELALPKGGEPRTTGLGATLRHVRYVLRENMVTGFAFGLFVLIVLAAAFGPALVPYDPLASDTAAALKPPSLAHWFGTDQLGRDVASRVVVATRLDFFIAVASVALVFLMGGIAGVATTADAEGIMVYDNHTNYKEWEFVFTVDKLKIPPNPVSGGIGTPASQMGSIGGNQIGTPVRDGNLEFTVSRIHCGEHQVGTGLVKRTAAGQYCLVEVKVKNVKTDARTLYEPFQKLVDSAGNKHSADITMRVVFRDQTIWDKIEPGQQVRGTMVFDIPKDVSATSLELHDGIASGGVTVRIR